MQPELTPWFDDPNAPTEREKNSALGIHLAVLAGVTILPIIGLLISIVLWLLLRGKSEFVNRHGWAVANLFISLVIYVIVLSGVILGSFAFASSAAEEGERTRGAILILAMFGSYALSLVLWLFNLIGSIMGAVRASSGKPHRYFHALPLVVPS